MGAKDTVMVKVPDCSFQDGSYPCGYRDGAKLPDCELCHKIRKAGIREVVEWMQKNRLVPIGKFRSPKREMISTINEDEWQAKLKEWGIE